MIRHDNILDQWQDVVQLSRLYVVLLLLVIQTTKQPFVNDDTECVQFQNKNYFAVKIQDTYGRILPILCDNKGIYDDYQCPREVLKEIDNQSGMFQYECCRTESITIQLNIYIYIYIYI